RSSGEVALHCADATRLPLPPGDVVAFFYNSFQDALLERFLDHLEASVRETPRRLLLVYTNPIQRAAVERRPAFRRLAEGRSRTGLVRRRHQRVVVFGAGFEAAELSPPEAAPTPQLLPLTAPPAQGVRA
ncbi:MAG TPA: hypothetical protein VFO83_02575, partial [Aggregicoccus sp.]|nr:hypothetical protein [Aggregicoccus sp.]